jgi:hypothetical protein
MNVQPLYIKFQDQFNISIEVDDGNSGKSYFKYGTIYDSPMLLMPVHLTSARQQGAAKNMYFFFYTLSLGTYGQRLYNTACIGNISYRTSRYAYNLYKIYKKSQTPCSNCSLITTIKQVLSSCIVAVLYSAKI